MEREAVGASGKRTQKLGGVASYARGTHRQLSRDQDEGCRAEPGRNCSAPPGEQQRQRHQNRRVGLEQMVASTSPAATSRLSRSKRQPTTVPAATTGTV